MVKERIDHFEYDEDEYLGEGGFGKVYKGMNLQNKSKVAVKVCHIQEKEDIPYLESEISVLKKMDHKNIIKLIHSKILGDKVYLVMELCEADLCNYHASLGRNFSEAEARNFLRQSVKALKYIHDQQICHRDIKPQNIMVTITDGKIVYKFADFGLAKMIDGTKTMTYAGTKDFMAPELKMRLPANIKVDIYSLGKTVKYLLTGDTETSMKSANVSKKMKKLITRMTQKDPKKRFGIDDVCEYLSGDNNSGSSSSGGGSPRKGNSGGNESGSQSKTEVCVKYGDKSDSCQMPSNTTIYNLKEEIASIYQIPTSRISLQLPNEMDVPDDNLLQTYGKKALFNLILKLRLSINDGKNSFVVEVPSNKKLHSLKQQISTKIDLKPNKIFLELNEEILDHTEELSKYELHNMDSLNLIEHEDISKVFIKWYCKTFSFLVLWNMTIRGLKRQLSRKIGQTPNSISLNFNGLNLNDDDKLGPSGIKNNVTLVSISQLPGGNNISTFGERM